MSTGMISRNPAVDNRRSDLTRVQNSDATANSISMRDCVGADTASSVRPCIFWFILRGHFLRLFLPRPIPLQFSTSPSFQSVANYSVQEILDVFIH